VTRCNHCGEVRLWSSRGLCWRCHRDPRVREAFADPAPSATDNDACDFYGRGKPTTPTAALPGSPEKIEVLTQRAQSREAMFHPEDATW
jgi:hypothetical protein